MSNASQRGNVLFLILIAVVLFAALSFAVTQSNRGGGDTDRESFEIEVSQLVQYLSSIKFAIDRMKLISGCADEDIDFWGGGGATPECAIFTPEGGNIPVKEIPGCCGVVDTPLEGYQIPASNNSCSTSNGTLKISMQSLWAKGIGQDYETDLILMVCGDETKIEAICDELDLYNTTSGTQFSEYLGTHSTTGSDPTLRQLGFSGSAYLPGRDIICAGSGATKRLYMLALAR